MAQQRAVRSARDHALAVLRARNGLVAVALLPAAVLAVLLAAGAAGHLAPGWTPPRVALAVVAVTVLTVAAVVAATIARARPVVTPTLAISASAAPELHAEIRDLAARLDVPEPAGIALTPDCDSWLEEPSPRSVGPPFADRPRADGPAADRRGRAGPVLVIGSPVLWWLRVPELRALLAPVVAGTGPARHPDVAAARRCVRGLDAAAAAGERSVAWRAPRVVLAGRVARLLLRLVGEHAVEMERGVAAAAAARARAVDSGLRASAQEQVGLAYAGWDRLLTRVAAPAWRLGRWPRRLHAGVVSSLADLSRRDRLAEGYASRLSQRPASDLLVEPAAVDADLSLLAARLFHSPRIGTPESGGEAAPAPGRRETARHTAPGPVTPTGHRTGPGAVREGTDAASAGFPGLAVVGTGGHADHTAVEWHDYPAEVVDRLWRERAARLFDVLDAESAPELVGVLRRLSADGGEFAEQLAARLTARVARDAAPGVASAEPAVQPPSPGGPGPLGPPPQGPSSGADVLAQHVAAVVSCAAVDTTEARPGLDWLDGPVLESPGGRLPGPDRPAYALVEEADPGPLREWLRTAGLATDQLARPA